MVDHSDSFFSIREDIDITTHKRASPIYGSNRPLKKRTLDVSSSHGNCTRPATRPQSTISKPEVCRCFSLQSSKLNTPFEAPAQIKSKPSQSFSLAMRSKEEAQTSIRAGAPRRRLSEAAGFLKDMGRRCKESIGSARAHRDHSSEAVHYSHVRSRANSLSWSHRHGARVPEAMTGPIVPTKMSSMEVSSRESSPGLYPPQAGQSAREEAARHALNRRVRNYARQIPDHERPHPYAASPDFYRESMDSTTSFFNSRHGSRPQLYKQLSDESDAESGIDMDLCVSRRPLLAGREMSPIARVRKDPVSHLPTELVSQVFRHLDWTSLQRAQGVSKQWRELAADSVIQKDLFLSKWQPTYSTTTLPAPVGGKGIGKSKDVLADPALQNWGKMYKARCALERNWREGNEQTSYLFSHTDSVYCVQFDEHKAITGSRDQTIRVWDLETKKCLKVIGGPNASEKDRRRAPLEGELTPAMEKQIRASGYHYYPAAEAYHTPAYWHKASILCLQYDEEILVTGSSDTTLIVWDMKTFEPIRRLARHTSGVLDLAFDEDKIVSCSKDFSICIWDRATGELLAQIEDHQGPVNAIQLRGDTIVSASGEGSSHLYRLNYKRTPGRRPGDEPVVSCRPVKVKEFWSRDRGLACIEYSDDGKYVLAGGNDHEIFRYDTEDTAVPARIEQRMRGHDGLVRSLYLDGANGRTISGSYDLSIKVWDYEPGNLMKNYSDKTTSWILSAKGDYRRIVATSQDGKVVIMDFGAGVDGVKDLVGN